MPRKPMNLDGQRFGSLTVEHITDQRNGYGRLLYLCRCDCGNVRLATAANLKRGEITRCEACQGKTHMKDLTGQRFGKLIAIKPVDAPTAKRTTYKWLCACDCGNVATDIERTIYNFANGLYNVNRSIERPNEKFRSKAYQYKGWTVILDKEESQP